jgi:hypothetical protein
MIYEHFVNQTEITAIVDHAIRRVWEAGKKNVYIKRLKYRE